MVAHGGNLRALAEIAGCSAEDIVDFSANLNPCGPPLSVTATLQRYNQSIDTYPEPENLLLRRALAVHYGCTFEQVAVGRGATELIYTIPRCLNVRRAVIVAPSYGDYALACEKAKLEIQWIFTDVDNKFAFPADPLRQLVRDGDLVFIGRPNNPNGVVPNGNVIRSLCGLKPDALFVVDESFIEFSSKASLCEEELPSNCIVVRSLTKFYAIPGIRLGTAVAASEIAQLLRNEILPWSIDTLGQLIGESVLNEVDYAVRTREFVAAQRQELSFSLNRIPGLSTFPSDANFLLVLADAKIDVSSLADRCLKNHRVALRKCEDYQGLDSRFFRVAVRSRAENELLCHALKDELGLLKAPGSRIRRRTKTLMFQGTSSNAGKSILTAALCRILHRQGVSVAPFKAQNMSLNSFVTAQGHEMGRAQVLQAAACRLQPDVRMNPVLLKPNNDIGSQVIVNGVACGNMKVGDYLRFKPEVFESVKRAFDELSSEHDAVVLEGAGSPAEVNLKSHDIVNMGMAKHAQSPVLIVGDIDRGGVFASFIGTHAVLDKEERALTRGFVVNRFRGDPSLLESAFKTTFDFTGVPTLGVVPFIPGLGLPEEDSVSFKERCMAPSSDNADINIALIDLPHVSNFTDFDPLEGEPDVHLRIVSSPEELGMPDVIILPGSKNTGSDLKHLKSNGLANAIIYLANTGASEVVGVCGGYQMLGERLVDNGVECSIPVSLEGLRLLPIRTEMNADKVLSNIRGVHVESGCDVRGYEIHHGRTMGIGLEPVLKMSDGTAGGGRTADGRIWGTYLHGLFDEDRFRRWWIDTVRKRKGLVALETVQFVYDIDVALERLANEVERSINMSAIYMEMGL